MAVAMALRVAILLFPLQPSIHQETFIEDIHHPRHPSFIRVSEICMQRFLVVLGRNQMQFVLSAVRAYIL